MYTHDSEAVIQNLMNKLSNTGGVVKLTGQCYGVSCPIVLDTPSLCLDGGVWACNTDPNGVFETKFGTKLRANRTDYPLLVVGQERALISGAVVKDLGFQGDIHGMDARPLVDFDAPEKNAGICFASSRTDQCEFSKLAFCGLANGVAVTGNAELDACIFEKINADGCGNGVWFAPRASYYTRFRACVIADNPFYGFYLNGKGRHIHNLEIQDCYFVRNGGAFKDSESRVPAAVFFDNASQCAVTHCIFDAPGTFWYYDDDAKQNNQRQPSEIRIPALRIIGDENSIRDNSFLNSSDDSISIVGNRNILIGNIVDGNVRISGEGNVVSTLVFTNRDARLILEGGAKDTTILQNVEQWRIVRS